MIPTSDSFKKENQIKTKFLTVFSDRMLPFVKPLAMVSGQINFSGKLKIGDLIAVKKHGFYSVSRVVQKISNSQGDFYVTKADNRSGADMMLLRENELKGIVLIERKNLGRLIALLSRFPVVLAASAGKFFGWNSRQVDKAASLLQPILLFNRLKSKLVDNNKKFVISQAKREGLSIRNYAEGDLEGIVQLWNNAFPKYHVSLQDFKKKVRGSHWFSEKACFVAVRGSNIRGFLFTSQRSLAAGMDSSYRKGVIECIAVDLHERRKKMGTLLLNRGLDYLSQVNCRRIETGFFPVAYEGDEYLGPDSTIKFFYQQGFQLMNLSQRFMTYPGRLSRRISEYWQDRALRSRVTIRLAEAGDRSELEETIRRWKERWYLDDAQCQDTVAASQIKTYVIAVLDGRIVGSCRAFLMHEISTYDGMDWIWDIAASSSDGSVGDLYVEKAYAKIGIGAMLVSRAFDFLFARGALTLYGQTNLPTLQARYRRWGDSVGGVALMGRSSGLP